MCDDYVNSFYHDCDHALLLLEFNFCYINVADVGAGDSHLYNYVCLISGSALFPHFYVYLAFIMGWITLPPGTYLSVITIAHYVIITHDRQTDRQTFMLYNLTIIMSHVALVLRSPHCVITSLADL